MPASFELQAQKALEALNAGRIASALKTARAALRNFPNDGYFSNLAGLALVQMGDARAAVPFFLAARRAEPQMIEAAHNLAQALILCGETAKAQQATQTALAQWPADARLLYLAASAPFEAGDASAALAVTSQAMQSAPDDAALNNLHARALAQAGRTEEAEVAFNGAVACAPADAEVRRTFARFLIHQARAGAALDQIKAGLAALPQSQPLLLEQASLQQQFGDVDGAIISYRQVLTSEPGNATALNGLAHLLTGPEARALRAPIAKALRAPGHTRGMKLVLSFAAARIAQTTETAEKLSKANRMAARAMPYDPHREAAEQDLLLAPFEAGIALPQPQISRPKLVFIIGLLRTGTTLAEQMLARHPDVATVGEWPVAGRLTGAQAQAFADTGSAPDGADFANRYLASLPRTHRTANHVIDKMPDNFRAVGYLLNAFPDAVVVEMQRDPRDVALSMWRELFPTPRHAHTNSFAGMAAHMNLYARFMNRWRVQFGPRIYALSYADLVTDTDQSTRRLAAVCGLEWNAAMLRPDQGDAPVMTASAQQVRQPIHTESLDKWRGQDRLLAPLMAGLDPDLWPQVAAT